MKVVYLTDEEAEALRIHFPRVPLSAVVAGTAEARAIKKLVPGALPHATERDTPLDPPERE